jgi:phosphohistidine phosphatase
MIIHFIRHAQAIKRTTALPDEHRYLTCRGRKRFRKISATLRKLDIDPDYIFTSPKIRAVQTADILAEKLLFSGDCIITPLLGNFTLQALQDLMHLYPLPKECVVVGHEPDFSIVIGQLLNLPTCSVAKGSVVSLTIVTDQPTLTAELTQLITSGGKLISNLSKALARLQTEHADSLEGHDQ